ncbi:transmembrane protein 217-like [Pleurodeles waltl]
MILVSVMHIVFEGGHLKELVRRANATYNPPGEALEIMMSYICYVTYGLLSVTIIVCFVLLVSAYLNIYKGLLVYISWMLFYEICRLILLVLSCIQMQRVEEPLNSLQWVGVGFRLPLQAFFMVYVVTFLLELTESRGRLLTRRRKAAKKRKTKSQRLPPSLKFAVKDEA